MRIQAHCSFACRILRPTVLAAKRRIYALQATDFFAVTSGNQGLALVRPAQALCSASRIASSLNSRLYCVYDLRFMEHSYQGKYPLFRMSTKRG